MVKIKININIEANGNCGPSSLSAELILAFYRGELDLNLQSENFKKFVHELCTKNSVNFNGSNVKASLQVFFAKYPNNAQVLLAQHIRPYMANLVNREDAKHNVFAEFKREWESVGKGESLNQGEHIFWGMQATLKNITGEDDLMRYYNNEGIFDYYINAIKKDKEYINVEPCMTRFAEHLGLNLTVRGANGDDNKYVEGVKVGDQLAATLRLQHGSAHFQSLGWITYQQQRAEQQAGKKTQPLIQEGRKSTSKHSSSVPITNSQPLSNLNKRSNNSQKLEKFKISAQNRTSVFLSHSMVKSLLQKGIENYVEDERVKGLSKEERQQIKIDYEFAGKEQIKEIDDYKAYKKQQESDCELAKKMQKEIDSCEEQQKNFVCN